MNISSYKKSNPGALSKSKIRLFSLLGYRMLFIVLVSLSALLPMAVEAGHLVAIVAANTLPREENMGREHDVLKAIEELEMISELTGLQLDLNIYIHEDYNSEILKKIEQISVESDDILFFYYSGHGYRTTEKNPEHNPWPNFHISLDEKGVDFQTINEILKDKNPRLLISLANSCNKILNREVELIRRRLIPQKAVAADIPHQERASSMKENYKKLFLESVGEIISSSALPGEYSYRSPRTGSIYLEAFLNSLHQTAEVAENPEWEVIFQQTIRKTREATTGRQTPQVVIAL